MSANGRLTAGELHAIPSGRLAKDAALSWNDMRDVIFLHTGIWIVPAGPNSSYRTFAAQVYFWNLYVTHRGNVAARPGTSNHGLGHAVDTKTAAMAAAVIRYGAVFHWNHAEGQRVNEWWHMGYVGGHYAPRGKWWYLTDEERHYWSALQDQRTIAMRHGGWDKVDKSHLQVAVEAKHWLEARVKQIRKGNQVTANRRLRVYYISQVVR